MKDILERPFGTSYGITEGELAQDLREQANRIVKAVDAAEKEGKAIPSSIFKGLAGKQLGQLTRTANTICDLLV